MMRLTLPETPEPPEGWVPTLKLRFLANRETGRTMLQQYYESGFGDGEWFFVPFVDKDEA